MKTVKVNDLTIGAGIAKIAAVIACTDIYELESACLRLENCAYDMVEWRSDYFTVLDEESIIQATEMIEELLGGPALIYTYRNRAEGGKGGIEADKYLALNRFAADMGVADIIDLEVYGACEAVSDLIGYIQSKGLKVIASYHNMRNTPSKEEIVDVMKEMQSSGADIIKVAFMPADMQDVVRVLAAAHMMKEKYADRPFMAISMGDEGNFTRIFPDLIGSAIVYAASGEPVAPGQLSISEINSIREFMGG